MLVFVLSLGARCARAPPSDWALSQAHPFPAEGGKPSCAALTPNPQFEKDIDMDAWASSPCRLIPKVVYEMLELCERVNVIVYQVVAVNSTLFSSKVAAVVKAKNLAILWGGIDAANRFINMATEELRDAPLSHTVAFLKQWTHATSAFAAAAGTDLLRQCARDLTSASADVDNACPRWGDFVNDTQISLDSAHLQLIVDPKVGALPHAVRSLHQQLCTMREVANVLGIDDIIEHKVTKNVLRCAGNSLSFGKRTVRVAAAVKLLKRGAAGASVKDIDAILGTRSGLPLALLARLDALRAEVVAAGSKKASIGAAASAAAPQRRPASDSGVCSSASGGKRPKTGEW